MRWQERLRNSTAQLVETESREYKQKEHFKKVGKENHATILSLTEDLKFLIKRREEDLAEMAQVRLLACCCFGMELDVVGMGLDVGWDGT